MGTKVSYEWVIEERDEHGDAFSIDHASHIADAIELQRHLIGIEGRAAKVEIALVRHEYTDAGGETQRFYAYLRADGSLPALFSERYDDDSDVGDERGPSVPQRFLKEAAAARPFAEA